MAKLKLGAIEDLKPVTLTIELPAALHRDLVAYAEVLARERAQGTIEPGKLIAPLLALEHLEFELREPLCDVYWHGPKIPHGQGCVEPDREPASFAAARHAHLSARGVRAMANSRKGCHIRADARRSCARAR